MARRLAAVDERQADFFGSLAPPAATLAIVDAARPATVRQTKPKRDAKRQPSSPDRQDRQDAPSGESLDALATRLSPVELDELAAALPDDALAHLILAAVRQLRRRLARGSGGRGGSGRSRATALERVARQLAAELGDNAGSDDA